jgi:hypothetical protein
MGSIFAEKNSAALGAQLLQFGGIVATAIAIHRVPNRQ